MSMLRKFFSEAERRYSYRIKSVCEINEETIDHIEKVVVKYNPFDIGQIDKTILHRNPLDFPHVKAAEVYSVDVCLGLPVSPSVLRREIAESMGVHESDVMVRGENDPTEIETQRLNAEADIAEEAAGEKAETLLSTAADYPEHDEVDGASMYGNAYNGRLIQELKKVNAERRERMKVGKTHDYDDPKPDVPEDNGPEPDLGDVDPAETSKHGNLDDNRKKYKRVYRNGRVIEKDGVAVKREC